MKSTPCWYAVYTKPRWEKKVAALLTQKGLENYCPLNKVLKQWHDRKKLVEEPLFSSYVFVFATPTEFTEIKKTEGIINFVYWLGKPAVVREEEIITIKSFLGEYKEIKLEKTRINVDDRVQIVQGPLMHKEGTVLEVYHKTIKVLLPTLGYALVAQVEKSGVELIESIEANGSVRKNGISSRA